MAPTDNKLVGSSEWALSISVQLYSQIREQLNQELPSQFPQGQWLRRRLEKGQVGGKKRQGKNEQQAKFQGVVLEKIAHMLSMRGSVLPV